MRKAYELSALATKFTYRQPNIECKSKTIPDKWVTATIIGPTFMQANKKQETYVTGFQTVTRKCTLENKELLIITDREQALIDSCKISFRKCNLYRCTKHFKSNCEEVLNKIGILSPQQGLTLDVVFGETCITE